MCRFHNLPHTAKFYHFNILQWDRPSVDSAIIAYVFRNVKILVVEEEQGVTSLDEEWG